MGDKKVKDFGGGGTLYQPGKEKPNPPAKVKKPPRNRRELVSTSLELAGIVSFSAGLWLVAPWCGLIGLGLCLILLGVANSATWDGKAE